VKSTGVSLADPDRPVPAEMHYEGWKEISGVRFPTHRVNYHSGVKRGEVTTESIRVNAGLRTPGLVLNPRKDISDARLNFQNMYRIASPKSHPEQFGDGNPSPEYPHPTCHHKSLSPPCRKIKMGTCRSSPSVRRW